MKKILVFVLSCFLSFAFCEDWNNVKPDAYPSPSEKVSDMLKDCILDLVDSPVFEENPDLIIFLLEHYKLVSNFVSEESNADN